MALLCAQARAEKGIMMHVIVVRTGQRRPEVSDVQQQLWLDSVE